MEQVVALVCRLKLTACARSRKSEADRQWGAACPLSSDDAPHYIRAPIAGGLVWTAICLALLGVRAAKGL